MRPFGYSLALLFGCAMSLTATLARPVAVCADTLSDYNQNNTALEQLLEQRESAEAGVQQWAAAEQASLGQLATAETKLRGLLGERADLQARQPILAGKLADASNAAMSLDAERSRLLKRVDAMETWLTGNAPAPLTNDFRGYLRDRAALDNDSQIADAISSVLKDTRDETQSTVDRLGEANTEITYWQQQAQTLAGAVGGARERALAFNAELADIQKQGDDLATQVSGEFDALRAAGHPVGVAQIVAANSPDPIAEPAPWTASLAGYALPVGRTAASVVPGDPLFTTRDRLDATGVLGAQADWQAPVKGVVTTAFGDGTPFQATHYAVDIAARLYTPVLAAADGVVEYADLAASDNRLASYGLAVMIRHNDHVTSLYAHLDDRANGLAVKVGDHVGKGQIIGYVGLTGYSTGPHLHFEVRIDNSPIDPELLVRP